MQTAGVASLQGRTFSYASLYQPNNNPGSPAFCGNLQRLLCVEQ